MDREIRREAGRQYIRYFRVWFLVLGILAVLCAALGILRLAAPREGRGSQPSVSGRVFDYADVLTEEEETQLEQYIARCEERGRFDIVLVTIREDVERYGRWERVMEGYADDFYDEHDFGYDERHGDGLLILDNWYEGQKGTWLSTAGQVYARFTNRDVNRVLDAVEERVEEDPYAAYRAGIDAACDVMESGRGDFRIPWPAVVFLPLLAAVIYAAAHLHQEPAGDTTTATSYVAGGKPTMREQRDDFLHKNVVTTRIAKSGGGGPSGGGHAGGHVSRGGVSHGGGGRRR